jgi:UDP-2,3-diacylglucosamine pyrophosphatase LpxH
MRHSDFLSVSDLHLGYWGERNLAYSAPEKAQAFRAIIAYAQRHRVRELLLNGDTFDERKAAPALWRQDAGAVREALSGFGGEVHVLPGNHDGELEERDFQARLGPCHAPGTTVLGHPGDVLVTHGHVLETNRIWALLEQAQRSDVAELDRLVIADVLLRSEMEERDRFNKWTESYEAYSETGRRFGERGVNAFRRLRERIAGIVRRLPLPGHARRRAAGALASPTVEAAAHLSGAQRRWGAIFGHTHYPGVFRREIPDPMTGATRAVVVGNSGSFIHEDEPLSCLHVEPDARRMTLLGYDRARGEMLPLETASSGE